MIFLVVSAILAFVVFIIIRAGRSCTERGYHQYEAVYDELEAYCAKSTTYIHHVCKRCGNIIKRDVV